MQPWSGEAFRHLPDGSPFGVLDFRFASLAANNRWNFQGEPTLYLAGDYGVALAEFARHLTTNRSLKPSLSHRRRVYRLAVRLDASISLCEPGVWAALSLKEAPQAFSDTKFARATAKFLRDTTPAQGLFVPSLGFMDQPDRWNLVIFLEKLQPDPSLHLTVIDDKGTFDVQ
jgi:RES domain-containing protein